MTQYPKAERFLAEHPGWSLDQALSYVDEKLKELRQDDKQHISK